MSIPEAVLRNRCYHIHLGSSYTFLMCDLLRLGGHGGLLRPSCTAGLPARHILFGAGDLFCSTPRPRLAEAHAGQFTRDPVPKLGRDQRLPPWSASASMYKWGDVHHLLGATITRQGPRGPRGPRANWKRILGRRLSHRIIMDNYSHSYFTRY
jgi:hypothetical protein